MKSIIIKRIGVGSFAKYLGVANGILGVIYAVFAIFAAVPAIILHDDLSTLGKIGASLGATVLIVAFIPAIMFAVGWVYGALVSFVINLFLSASKGIELDIQEEK